LEKALRLGSPPVITIVKEDYVMIDPRTLLDNQAQMIPQLIAKAFEQIQGQLGIKYQRD
jgi:hypothetical protein